MTMLNSATTWGGSTEFEPLRRRQMVPDVPDLKRTEYGVPTTIGTRALDTSSHTVFPSVGNDRDFLSSTRDAKVENEEKADVLNATVKNVESDFVIVAAAPGGEPVDIQIPLVLCPDELRVVGQPIAISVQKVANYSSLKIEKREKQAQMSSAFQMRLAAVSEWADSL